MAPQCPAFSASWRSGSSIHLAGLLRRHDDGGNGHLRGGGFLRALRGGLATQCGVAYRWSWLVMVIR